MKSAEGVRIPFAFWRTLTDHIHRPVFFSQHRNSFYFGRRRLRKKHRKDAAVWLILTIAVSFFSFTNILSPFYAFFKDSKDVACRFWCTLDLSMLYTRLKCLHCSEISCYYFYRCRRNNNWAKWLHLSLQWNRSIFIADNISVVRILFLKNTKLIDFRKRLIFENFIRIRVNLSAQIFLDIIRNQASSFPRGYQICNLVPRALFHFFMADLTVSSFLPPRSKFWFRVHGPPYLFCMSEVRDPCTWNKNAMAFSQVNTFLTFLIDNLWLLS